MGMESSRVAARIIARLTIYVEKQGSGHVFDSDGSYRCFPDAPDKVRRPDVSFVTAGRFPGEVIPKGYSSIPPDLAVEVLSPNDLAYDVAEKVEEYLSAGVRLVWVVDPNSHVVQIHRPASSCPSSLRQTLSCSFSSVVASGR